MRCFAICYQALHIVAETPYDLSLHLIVDAAFWIGKTAAWRQRDGKANLDVAGPGTIKLAVLQIPA